MTTTQMSSVVVAGKRGGPRTLRLSARPIQRAGTSEVRIAVHAAGVAFGDVLLREGVVRDAPWPRTPGYDVAGVVDELGDGVDRLAVGDSVIATTGGWGGYAEHVVVPDWRVVPYPARLLPESATSLVLNYLTAFQMLERTTHLDQGSTVLIHSAAGGVGGALVQLGALRGLNMIGTASTGKLAQVAAAGATPVDYRVGDTAALIRAEAPDGLDAIFDGLGPASWRSGYPLLRTNGVLVPYGIAAALPSGRRSIARMVGMLARTPRTDYLDYFRRGVGVVGYSSGPMALDHRDWYRADLTALVHLLEQGQIHPLIHKTFPLMDAAAAHEELGSGRTVGKIVLLP